MASTQEFRRRIKSVNSTSQITKAMEMVASVKMQKAQKTILAARSYIQNSWNTLEMLAKITSPDKHPLLKKRPVKKTGLMIITSDRGLCGGYNTNILNKTLSFIKKETKIGVDSTIIADLDLISIGQKGTSQIAKLPNGQLVAEFTGFGKEVEFAEISPVVKMIIDDYLAGKYDQIVVIYSHFESSLRQTPVVKQILPITTEHIDIPELWEKALAEEEKIEFKFEPDPDAILEAILKQFISIQIFGAILESNASEHSARMVAMKNATDNAKDLIDDLTLTYNSVRQDSITREIAEICAGAEAMR